MKSWRILIAALLGLMAVILVVSPLHWVVLRQVDVLTGKWKLWGGKTDFRRLGDPYWVRPIQGGIESLAPPPDEQARFFRLLRPIHDDRSPTAYEGRFADLFAICEARADRRYWATLVCQFAFQAQAPSPDQHSRGSFVNDPEVQDGLLRACDEGARLDPENALFPMIRAGILYRIGDKKRCRETFLEASKKSVYADYGNFEPYLRFDYLVKRYGYRGHDALAWILSETRLPHQVVLLSLGRYFSKPDDVPGRVAAARLAGLMMTQSESFIGVVVGRDIFLDAVDPGKNRRKEPELKPNEVVRRAETLKNISGTELNLVSEAELCNQVTKNVLHNPLRDISLNSAINLGPASSAWTLLALLILPVAMGFVWLKSKWPRFAAAAPYLVWALAFLIQPTFRDGALEATYIGCASLLFFPNLSSKLRKYVDVLGLLVSALAFILSVNSPALVIPASMFILALAFESRAKKSPSYVTIVGSILACGCGAFYWVAIAVQLGVFTGVVYGLVATLASCSIIPVRPPVKWSTVWGGAGLALVLLYAVAVTRDVLADKQITVICHRLADDGNAARS